MFSLLFKDDLGNKITIKDYYKTFNEFRIFWGHLIILFSIWVLLGFLCLKVNSDFKFNFILVSTVYPMLEVVNLLVARNIINRRRLESHKKETIDKGTV